MGRKKNEIDGHMCERVIKWFRVNVDCLRYQNHVVAAVAAAAVAIAETVAQTEKSFDYWMTRMTTRMARLVVVDIKHCSTMMTRLPFALALVSAACWPHGNWLLRQSVATVRQADCSNVYQSTPIWRRLLHWLLMQRAEGRVFR